MIYRVVDDCVCGCGKRRAIKSGKPIKNPPRYHHSKPYELPKPRPWWKRILGIK